MQAITTDQLKRMFDRREDFVLVNVLDEEQFNREHIPGSKNVPVGDEDFTRKMEQVTGGRDRTVVVYCASSECDASPKAAKKLERVGFTNVYDYEAGMRGWHEAHEEVATGA